MGFCMVRSVFVGYFCIYFFLSLYFWVIPHGLLFLQLLLRSKFHDGTEGRCLEAIVHVQPLVLEGSHPLPPGLSNSWPVALRVAQDGAQHKTVNLLKTFFCSSVSISACVFSVWPKITLLPVWPRRWKVGHPARYSVQGFYFCFFNFGYTAQNCSYTCEAMERRGFWLNEWKLACEISIIAYNNFKCNFWFDFKVGYHIKVTLDGI